MKKINLILIFAVLFSFNISFGQDAAKQPEGKFKSFQVKKGGMLEVEVSNGDIIIDTWGKNEVTVNAKGISKNDLDNLKIEQSGNTISIIYRPDNGYSNNVKFEIMLPDQFDTDLNTSGGNLIFRGSLSGTLKGKTSGGDIKFKNVGGKIEMSTSGGDITTENIQGDGHLSTSGGDIRLGLVSGEIRVNTSGGDIRVTNVGKSLKASTSGGDIEIGDVGGEAKVSTSGGDIKVGKVGGKASLSTSGGDIELQSASGTVTAKTSGGNLKLYNISGSIDASTSGGEIEAELYPSGNGKSKLTSSGGDIVLSIPENAKAKIEAKIYIRDYWRSNNDKWQINSDFKYDSYKKDEDAKEIRATYLLNGGGESIILETSNSNIEIKKLKK